MKFQPALVWCALFALLANSANGAGCVTSAIAAPADNICDAQFMIALMDANAPSPTAYTGVVCDFQRALDTVGTEEPPAGAEGDAAIHAVVPGWRVTLPNSASILPLTWTFHESAAITLSYAAPRIPSSIPISFPDPLLRFQYQLSPHAPPIGA